MVVLNPSQHQRKQFDWLIWLSIFALLIAGLIANYYYAEIAVWVRSLAWVVLLAVVALAAAQTQKGKWTINFFKESRLELRKVVWPTKDETMKTTLVVAVMVIVLALILWGMDGILVWVVGWLTGQSSS